MVPRMNTVGVRPGPTYRAVGTSFRVTSGAGRSGSMFDLDRVELLVSPLGAQGEVGDASHQRSQ